MSRFKSLLVEAGLHHMIGGIYGGRGAILVFHRIRTRDPRFLFETNHRNSVAPDAFRALLDVIAETGVEIVSLDEAMTRLNKTRAGRFVCLTFDDGYRDNYGTVLPIVTRRAIPITVYVAPGLIDGTAPLWWYGLDMAIAGNARILLPLGDGDLDAATVTLDEKQRAFDAAAGFMLRAGSEHSARLAQALASRYGIDFQALAREHMMDWAMVREMAASPHIEIGAHTMSHPSLANLGDDEAGFEMSESRRRLETETGNAVRHFAYPFGESPAIGRRETVLARDAGFGTAVTTAPGNLFARRMSNPFALPRHGIGPRDGADSLRLKLAGFRRFSLRDWRPLVTAPA